jgi:aminoglycoside phosphotransferase (APT) family kinase protein
VTDLPGLPTLAAMAWLREARPDLDFVGEWRADVIAGGLSNITYRISWAGTDYILRRPPLGDVLPRAHDMGREYRVMTALAPTAVPVPETIALCADASVIGAPFYLMRAVPGAVLRAPADTAVLAVAERSAVSDELVQALVALHSVDLNDVGLSDFGRHGGYAARQVATWGGQWERSRTRDLPDMDALLAALTDAIPSSDTTTLVHGDFRLDNTIVQFRPEPQIAAILDWELSTLGDPIADLGLMLTYWHDPGDAERAEITVAAGITDHEGFPTAAALAQRYAELSGRDLSTLPFHLALAAMKLAVILEGVHARYLKGQTVSPGYETAGSAVATLAARGLRLVNGPDDVWRR